MSTPELERLVRVRPHPPERMTITATEPERTALAERFGVAAVDSLAAELALALDGDAVVATGRLTAELVQTCAVSGEDFPTRIDERLALRFVPTGTLPETEEEIEFASNEPDEIEFEGDAFDLGEAIAQSLGLAIDPYAEGPNADAARREAGIIDESAPRGPLADLLQGLKRK